MKPYETTEELIERAVHLEKALQNARQMRYILRTSQTYQVTSSDEEHFRVFEELIMHEIQMIKFHIDLETILSEGK